MLVGFLTKEIKKRGATLHSCDGAGNGDSPTDKLLARIIDCFAEYERDLIRARTSAALQRCVGR